VVEFAGQGTDTVVAWINHTLAASVENLTLTGSALIGVGNALDNVITGNALANTLSGGAGADRMVGGAGNDIYYVENAGDVVVEAAGQGTDRVVAWINHTLAANVENLTLTGSAVSGSGNTLNNVIVGTTGNNVLAGGWGNDTLTGGAGSDTFLFNTSLNRTSNVDRITDFNVAADTIRLDNAVFKGLGEGWLAAGAFHTGTAAADAQDRIIYNKTTGALSYDADGSGSGAAVHFATVSAGLALTNADFFVI
jgi:Ca2+-binding RTX toxin-like protein